MKVPKYFTNDTKFVSQTLLSFLYPNIDTNPLLIPRFIFVYDNIDTNTPKECHSFR